MTPLVSVIVPTFRRPDLLGRCLDALASQVFDPQEIEIIVADDANSEQTRELVRAVQASLEPTAVSVDAVEYFGGDEPDRTVRTSPRSVLSLSPIMPTILYVPVTSRHGPAAARNAGLRVARGEIIAFTDDDCIPTPEWLLHGVAAFTEGVDGVSGRVIVPHPDTPTDYEHEQVGLERSEFITANCFYRRPALEAVGGFDERYSLAWREDSDLYFTLLEHGCNLVHSPEPVVIHPIRPAPWGVSLRQQQKAQYNALCYKKHPLLYATRFRLRAPWYYYGSWIAILLVVIGLGFSMGWLAALGAVGFGLQVGWFTLQRLRGTSKRAGHVLEMALTSAVIPFLSIYWRLRGAIRFRVFYF